MALLPEAILTNKIRFSAHPQVYLLTIFKAVTPVLRFTLFDTCTSPRTYGFSR